MRRRSISLHVLLGLLLIVYGVLWVLLHRLEASPLESSVLSASLSNHVVPSLQSHGNRTIDTEAEQDERLDLPTQNWENRLVDGEYLQYPSGSNLWDHTDLPTWMKGEERPFCLCLVAGEDVVLSLRLVCVCVRVRMVA